MAQTTIELRDGSFTVRVDVPIGWLVDTARRDYTLGPGPGRDISDIYGTKKPVISFSRDSVLASSGMSCQSGCLLRPLVNHELNESHELGTIGECPKGKAPVKTGME